MNKDIPLSRFVGFDSGGEVFLSQGHIFRGIHEGYGPVYRSVLEICKTHNLFRYGIVETHESCMNPARELHYDLILEHERVPFISYPHEWPSSMLKAAALFHIDLYDKLAPHGLTLKDWHPFNILFKATEPIFVDFASIIHTEDLPKEEYLTPPHTPLFFRHSWDIASQYFFEMYRRMFVPYFLRPLYMMHQTRHKRARILMAKTIMNASKRSIALYEAFPLHRSLSLLRYGMWSLAKQRALLQKGPAKWNFLSLLRKEIESLPVSPQRSGYSSYYAEKKELIPFEPSSGWNGKHWTIHDTIERLRPQTLLDIGSNTGWFSVLAAKLGCQVVAFDLDEACVELLYKQSRKDNLPILPLVMDLSRLTPDVSPAVPSDHSHCSQITRSFPLILSADKRLRCDMVLALALVHHLALGQGKSFSEIVRTLSGFAERYLVVEFVRKDDQLVVAEPTFFPAFHGEPGRFGWYSLENFKGELERSFRSVEIRESYPESRSILICEK